MYHMITPERHSQFGGAEASDDLGFAPPETECEPLDLLAAFGGAVGGFDQPKWGRGADLQDDGIETQNERASLAGQPEKIEAPPREQRLHVVGEALRGDGLFLETTRERALAAGEIDARAIGAHPDPPPRQPGGDVGNDARVRAKDEPDEAIVAERLAGYGAAPLPGGGGAQIRRGARVVQVRPSSEKTASASS